MSATTTYYKNDDGFILNNFHKDGDPVPLHPKQAKYMLPPLGGELRTTKEKSKPKLPAKKKTSAAPSAA